MTATLTTLIARAQALLLDDGTLFSTATLTAAFRDALDRFNLYHPQGAATQVDAVSDQLEYALNDADFTGMLACYGVWLLGENDQDEPLPFMAYWEDNAPFVRLQQTRITGETLLIRFALPHTLSGLDSATESTLTAEQDTALTDGACAIAIMTRLASRVETINLAPAVVENYKRAAGYFMDAFTTALRLYSLRSVGTGEKSTAAWNDAYHTFWPAGWDGMNG